MKTLAFLQRELSGFSLTKSAIFILILQFIPSFDAAQASSDHPKSSHRHRASAELSAIPVRPPEDADATFGLGDAPAPLPMDRPIYGIGRKARPALRTSALEVADYVAPADAAVPAPVPAPPPPEVGADVEKAAVDPEIERVRRRLGRLYDIIGGLVDAYATLHRATRYTLERGEELDGALAELRTYFKGLKRTLKEEIRECIDYLEANGAPEEEDAREE